MKLGRAHVAAVPGAARDAILISEIHCGAIKDRHAPALIVERTMLYEIEFLSARRHRKAERREHPHGRMSLERPHGRMSRETPARRGFVKSL
ncbi:hypothetical protein EVAR_44327_1 [Eumeta japonica]|uniref:Uncharacterized protein n=1 Tax=Eumeta variegata TaxID=151549 RepID=A0A4C1XC92_EUMVA|nr:hypothetical protein EVAR_44327_1 [Eumeta japonica]